MKRATNCTFIIFLGLGLVPLSTTPASEIYPTIVELAGLPVAPDLDGTSLVPILRDPRHEGRPFVLSQFSRPFKPTMPEVVGYSIRTPTHRYTRWVQWPSRETLHEELYDYGSGRSAVLQGAFFVERENFVSRPAYQELREQLRGTLERSLGARTNVEELKRLQVEEARKKKRRDRQEPSE